MRKNPWSSLWREMDEMRADLENVFRKPYASGRFLLPGEVPDLVLPVVRGDFRVDVRDHGDEVIIAADLPGLEKENISLQLLSPRALEISCGRREEREEREEGYYVRERISGSMRRVVALPADVTEEGSKAGFKNGVLEVTLKKTVIPEKSRIAIE